MAANLEYGLEELPDERSGRLYVDVPRGVWDKLSETRFPSRLGSLKRTDIRAVTVQAREEHSRILINDERIADSKSRTNQLYWVTNMLATVDAAAGHVRAEQPLRTALGVRPASGTGKLTGTIDLAGSVFDTPETVTSATAAMNEVAGRLKYEADDVFAEVDASRADVRLQVGSMAYVRDHFYPAVREGRLQLVSENMLSHEAQLVCLAGAVALSRAATLV